MIVSFLPSIFSTICLMLNFLTFYELLLFFLLKCLRKWGKWVGVVNGEEKAQQSGWKEKNNSSHPQCLTIILFYWYQCRLSFYISGCIWIYNCRRPPHDVHATQPLSSSASMQYICRRSRDCVLVALVEVVAFLW